LICSFSFTDFSVKLLIGVLVTEAKSARVLSRGAVCGRSYVHTWRGSVLSAGGMAPPTAFQGAAQLQARHSGGGGSEGSGARPSSLWLHRVSGVPPLGAAPGFVSCASPCSPSNFCCCAAVCEGSVTKYAVQARCCVTGVLSPEGRENQIIQCSC